MKIRVSLVDDHPVVTEGLQTLLRGEPDMDITGAYGSSAELLANLPGNVPDVLLMDIQMPGMHGAELVTHLLAAYPSLEIVALTNVDQTSVLQEMLQSGVRCYVLKTAGRAILTEAVRSAYGGLQFIDPEMKEAVYKQAVHLRKEQDNLPALTQREKEVLQLIVYGNTNQEIAEQLFLSQRTVEHHRLNIMFKLDARNTASLVRKALLLNLAE